MTAVCDHDLWIITNNKTLYICIRTLNANCLHISVDVWFNLYVYLQIKQAHYLQNQLKYENKKVVNPLRIVLAIISCPLISNVFFCVSVCVCLLICTYEVYYLCV